MTFTLTVILISIIFHVALCRVEEGELNFLLLHSAHINGQFEEIKDLKTGNSFGGCARMAHVVREARTAYRRGTGPPVMYLSSGNIYHGGSLWFLTHRGKICAEFMNSIQPDVIVCGESEFNFGMSRLLPYLKNLDIPVVATNLLFPEGHAAYNIILPFYVMNISGRKIGILGYVNIPRYLMGSSLIGSVEILEKSEVLDHTARTLKENGVTVVILLSTADIQEDTNIVTLIPSIDIVVGGHSDTFLWNGPPPDKEIPKGPYPLYIDRRDGKHALVAHSYIDTKYMGNLLVILNKEGYISRYEGQPIFLNQKITQEKDILDLLEVFRPEVERVKAKVVGQSKVFLDGRCQRKECNMGNLIADSFISTYARYYKGPHWTDVGVAFMNCGSVRTSINASIRANNVYLSDILLTFPYNNESLYTVELAGIDILQSLEHGSKSTDDGSLLITSGLRVVYDFSKPPGHRVESVRIRCALCPVPKYSKLDYKANYKVITTEYLIGGGDGHRTISDKGRAIFPLLITDYQALFHYFRTYSPVLQGADRRVIMKHLPSTTFRQQPELYLYFCGLLLVCYSFLVK